MVCSVYTGAVFGVGGYPVTVEVDMAEGLPCIDMVGYLGGEVKESAERVRVALKNLGYTMPAKRFTVNLSPAGIRKGGTAFDLPIAIGILACMGVVRLRDSRKILALGELGLDGSVRSVKGVLPILLAAKEQGICSCIIPSVNQKEGANIDGVQVIGVQDFYEVLDYLECPEKVESRLSGKVKGKMNEKITTGIPDFQNIAGQTMAKRAAEIAAAGFHNLLLSGPPGTGKSMIAAAMPGILPPMNMEEMLDTSKVYSVAGLLNEERYLIKERPFLNPHHTITPQALVGGGAIPVPGVISMANHGVLFLDELPEFKRQTLDMLRQPMEEGKITIARKGGTYIYPCDFMLVAAMNPCPCGYYPDVNRCSCSEKEVKRYIKSVSGPLLNRIDLSVGVLHHSYEQLKNTCDAECSRDIRRRVVAARRMQEKRNGMGVFNSKLPAMELKNICFLTREAEETVEKYYNAKQLSMRGYHRLLRVARTIADLEGSKGVEKSHVLEATSYRGLLDK